MDATILGRVSMSDQFSIVTTRPANDIHVNVIHVRHTTTAVHFGTAHALQRNMTSISMELNDIHDRCIIMNIITIMQLQLVTLV